MHANSRILASAHGRSIICVAFVCMLLACGDDSPPGNQIITGVSDTGGDASDISDTQRDADAGAPPDAEVSPACEGVEEGGSCLLQNAVGVCVRGDCRFLSCESGFRDCDDDVTNGCEADVTLDSRCGACSTSCAEAASCQLSSFGYTCSTTPVCQDGRLDLDGDTSNGCEFRIDDSGSFLARPGDIGIGAGDLADGTFWYAGQTSGGAVVGSTGSDEEPGTIDSVPTSDSPVDVTALLDDNRVLTAWSGGLSTTQPPQSSPSDAFVRPECAGPLDEHQLTGIDHANPEIVSAEHGLFERSTSSRCSGAECLVPTFDRIDYLRAYYPYPDSTAPSDAADAAWALSASSLSACDTCFLDEATGQLQADRGCLGETVCAQQAGGDCSGCRPDLGACPDFQPIAVRSSAAFASMVVVTRAGVLVIREDGQSWKGGPRAEDFLGDVRAVEAAIALDGNVATAFLLGDDERIYVARVDLAAGGGIRVERAPFKVVIPVDASSARLHAANDRELLLGSRLGAVLIRSTPRGNVQAPIPAPEAAVDANELVASGYDEVERSYGLLFRSLGQLTLRTVVFEPNELEDAE
ncbi:MAG: hypothetical protein ACQEVA_15365 [Myxococcota bacterium]